MDVNLLKFVTHNLSSTILLSTPLKQSKLVSKHLYNIFLQVNNLFFLNPHFTILQTFNEFLWGRPTPLPLTCTHPSLLCTKRFMTINNFGLLPMYPQIIKQEGKKHIQTLKSFIFRSLIRSIYQFYSRMLFTDYP